MVGAIYIAKNTNDSFRWIGFDDPNADEDGDSPFGILLAKLRWDPVHDRWTPPPIGWLPETIKRKVCDIPHFRTTMWCLNARAREALGGILERSGEILPLEGLDGGYSAFNCLERYNALDHEAMKARFANDPYYSIASDRKFVPLLADRIGRADVFKIPEAITQTFVTERFKAAYDGAGLTGLDFHRTEVR